MRRKLALISLLEIVWNLSSYQPAGCVDICVYKVMKEPGSRSRRSGVGGEERSGEDEKALEQKSKSQKEILVDGRGKSIYSKKLVIVVVTTLSMDEWMDGWMDRWMDGWTQAGINRGGMGTSQAKTLAMMCRKLLALSLSLSQ